MLCSEFTDRSVVRWELRELHQALMSSISICSSRSRMSNSDFDFINNKFDVGGYLFVFLLGADKFVMELDF